MTFKQCDQIGRFLKTLGNKFHSKMAHIFGALGSILKSVTFKSAVANFGDKFFGKNWAIFGYSIFKP